MADETGTETVDLENQDVTPETEGEASTETTDSESGEPAEAGAPELEGGTEPPQEEPATRKKSGVQKRIDEQTRKYHEEREARIRAEAKAAAYEEILQGRQNIAQTDAPTEKPVMRPMPQSYEFATPEEHAAATVEWMKEIVTPLIATTVPQMTEQSAMQKARQAKLDEWNQAVETASERLPGLSEIMDEVNSNGGKNSLAAMFNSGAILLLADEGGHFADIIHYLGTNRQELKRIAALPPALQGKEIAKVEIRLATKPTRKINSGAPEPSNMSPTGPSSTGKNIYTMSRKDRMEKWKKEAGLK